MGKLVGIITQGVLFQYIGSLWNDNSNNCALAEILDLKYITSPISKVNYNDKAFDVFQTMSDLKVSGLAVVDDDGILIHNTSSTDIKLWLISRASLEVPIEESLINIRNQPSLITKYPITYCTMQQSFQRAMKKLLATKYHRLWIVDNNKCPIGVFAVTDIFRFVCQTNERQQQYAGDTQTNDTQ